MAHVPHVVLRGPWEGPAISLDDGHVRHLRRVLRSSDGDAVSYTDGEGTIGSGVLEGDAVVRGEESSRERPSELTVAVAPPSSKQRARYVVEKLAELGVRELKWVDTAHTVGRAPPEDKALSWATSATEQSRGAWVMATGVSTLAELPAPTVFADPEGDRVWPPGVRSVVIGPEGGFAPTETEGRSRVSLGLTILRVETAAVVAATLHGRSLGGP